MAGYGGDVTAQAAFAAVNRGAALLIDVRSRAEWHQAGVPDLAAARFVEWQQAPDGRLNPDFARQCVEAGLEKGRAAFFLCRIGARSRHAAIAMTALGFGPCYNIAAGWEGAGGWQSAGLPWRRNEGASPAGS